ncbi:ferritin-like domain-containing protein, partial [Amylostereum chailletii]
EFANVLEQLETEFYAQALKKFVASDFTAAGFSSANIAIEQFTAISIDESTHTTILQETIVSLGATPVTSCSFDFSSVLTDVSTMMPVARLVEMTGVGAYLGAAHLVSDPTLLTAAASIVTVESRHQTILNIFSGGSASAIPGAFDLPLTPNEVLAIAGGFISGCDLGITANAALSITTTESLVAGTSLSFKSSAINGSTDVGSNIRGMHCQMLAGGLPFSISLPMSSCAIPAGITGPVAIFITSDDQPLNNNARDRIDNTVIAGPTIIFVDNQAQTLGSLVRNVGGSATNATVTQTISPEQATSILNSASPAATATSSESISTETIAASSASAIISSVAASATPANNAGSGAAPANGGGVVISMIPIPTSA